MYALAIGRKAAPARQLGRRPGYRREELLPPPALDHAPLSTETDAVLTSVSDVEVVTPVRKRYRGIVVRNRVERAIVEFDADETTDLYRVAEELIPQIPAEAWTIDPATDNWGYLERVEEAPAELVEVEEVGEPVDTPADLPASTLARRLRAMRARLLRAKGLARKMDAATALAEIDGVLAGITEIQSAGLAADEALAMLESMRGTLDSVTAGITDPLLGTEELSEVSLQIDAAYEALDAAIAAMQSAPAETLARRRKLRAAARRTGRKTEIFGDMYDGWPELAGLADEAWSVWLDFNANRTPEAADQVLAQLNDIAARGQQLAAAAEQDAAAAVEANVDDDAGSYMDGYGVTTSYAEAAALLATDLQHWAQSCAEELDLQRQQWAAEGAFPEQTLARRRGRKTSIFDAWGEIDRIAGELEAMASSGGSAEEEIEGLEDLLWQIDEVMRDDIEDDGMSENTPEDLAEHADALRARINEEIAAAKEFDAFLGEDIPDETLSSRRRRAA